MPSWHHDGAHIIYLQSQSQLPTFFEAFVLHPTDHITNAHAKLTTYHYLTLLPLLLLLSCAGVPESSKRLTAEELPVF